MKRSALLLFFFALLPGCGSDPVPVDDHDEGDRFAEAQAHYRSADSAYAAKDFAGYRDHLAAALALRPHHPTLTYLTAGAYALAGEPDGSLAALRRLAAMGIVVNPGEDADFASVTALPAYESLREAFRENAAPVGDGHVAFTLNEIDFIPEGVAYDPVDDAFFVSSVHLRKIIRVKDEATSVFSKPDDGLWSVFGLKVDPLRRHLWACSGAIDQTANLDTLQRGTTGVFKYDLKSGRLLKSYLLAPDPDAHWFGDLALDAAGNVYLTDSRGGGVYTIPADTDRLAAWLPPGTFRSPQGLDLSPEGTGLFVADYSQGVFRIDLERREPVLLETPETMTLLGIDGLYAAGDALVAIQNGIRPHRVVRLTLRDEGSGVHSLVVLAANEIHYDEPTLGVVVADTLFYVANSQWGHFNDDGSLRREDPLHGPVILKQLLTREQ